MEFRIVWFRDGPTAILHLSPSRYYHFVRSLLLCRREHVQLEATGKWHAVSEPDVSLIMNLNTSLASSDHPGLQDLIRVLGSEPVLLHALDLTRDYMIVLRKPFSDLEIWFVSDFTQENPDVAWKECPERLDVEEIFDMLRREEMLKLSNPFIPDTGRI